MECHVKLEVDFSFSFWFSFYLVFIYTNQLSHKWWEDSEFIFNEMKSVTEGAIKIDPNELFVVAL